QCHEHTPSCRARKIKETHVYTRCVLKRSSLCLWLRRSNCLGLSALYQGATICRHFCLRLPSPVHCFRCTDRVLIDIYWLGFDQYPPYVNPWGGCAAHSISYYPIGTTCWFAGRTQFL